MSWNGNDNKNPWGNNDGPPDIDEEIKKLRERFNKVFGGGTSPGGGVTKRSFFLLAFIGIHLCRPWSLSGRAS